MTVIIAKSRDELQPALNGVLHYCNIWKLQINNCLWGVSPMFPGSYVGGGGGGEHIVANIAIYVVVAVVSLFQITLTLLYT